MSPLEKELANEAKSELILNVLLWVGGTVLISMAFSWEVGLGIGLFLLFMRGPK